MVSSAQRVVVVNKIDLLPHLDYDIAAKLLLNIRSVNPDATIMQCSAKTGEGVHEFRHWLLRAAEREAAPA